MSFLGKKTTNFNLEFVGIFSKIIITKQILKIYIFYITKTNIVPQNITLFKVQYFVNNSYPSNLVVGVCIYVCLYVYVCVIIL